MLSSFQNVIFESDLQVENLNEQPFPGGFVWQRDHRATIITGVKRFADSLSKLLFSPCGTLR